MEAPTSALWIPSVTAFGEKSKCGQVRNTIIRASPVRLYRQQRQRNEAVETNTPNDTESAARPLTLPHSLPWWPLQLACPRNHGHEQERFVMGTSSALRGETTLTRSVPNQHLIVSQSESVVMAC